MEPSTASDAAPPLRILLVDDERLVRDLLRSRLEGEGFEVVDEADRAKTAVALALIHQPDLVSLDLLMPGVGGIDIIETLRDASEDTSVIVYTALDSPAAVAAAEEAGALAVVDKAGGHLPLLDEIRRLELARD
jgi:response regulator NasT